ncbi:MAG: hypothetical protein KDC17_14525, partial [Actinobacteria bacterium]|nr:hypothetical protein [Actinomycetota bacterium]
MSALPEPAAPRPIAWSPVIGTLIVLAMGVSYFVWRLLMPSSCAWIPPDASSWTAEGALPRHTDDCP